jgi:hypothetical protein
MLLVRSHVRRWCAVAFPWQPWSCYLQPGTKQSNQKPHLCFSSRHSLW